MKTARHLSWASTLLLVFSGQSLAAVAQADLEQKYGFGTGAGTSSRFSAYSNETLPLARGPNDFTFYKIQYSGQQPPFGNPTTVTPVPVDNGATIKIPTGLFGWGAGRTYTPIVSMKNQPKPDNTNAIYDMSLSSTSFWFSGRTYCYSKDGKINISASTGILAPPDAKAAGQAAAEASDPIRVYRASPVLYAPILGAEVQLDNLDQSGGVAVYATDTWIDPSSNGWEYESDPVSLWRLTMNAAGPVSSVSQLNVTFDFNPSALNEIQFGSYLATLPGYYSGISNTDLALLINAQVENAVKGAITIEVTGQARLSGFQLFPDDTIYTPFEATQDYSEGTVANLEQVPEPQSLALILLATALGGRRRRRPIK